MMSVLYLGTSLHIGSGLYTLCLLVVGGGER